MKKIKFRGILRSFKDKYIYGDLKHIGDEIRIDGYLVYPESVAQFVGLDADGNEVYEGDKFTDKFGHIFTARLLSQGFCKDGHIRFDWLPKSCDFHIFSDDFNVEESYCDENFS